MAEGGDANPASNQNQPSTSGNTSKTYKGKLNGVNKQLVNSIYGLYRMKHHPKCMANENPFQRKVDGFLKDIHPAGGPLPKERQEILVQQGKEFANTIKEQLLQEYKVRGETAHNSVKALSSSIEGELQTLIELALKYCKMRFRNRFQVDTWKEILKELNLPYVEIPVTRKRRRVSSQEGGGEEEKKEGGKAKKKKAKKRKGKHTIPVSSSTNQPNPQPTPTPPPQTVVDVQKIVKESLGEELNKFKGEMMDLLKSAVAGLGNGNSTPPTNQGDTTPAVEKVQIQTRSQAATSRPVRSLSESSSGNSKKTGRRNLKDQERGKPLPK
ncbi:unnamed protein product [Dimorphilus gyrociliatus]|uniref:Uncharacterized protein n=1 Tax=Dimorphilus gyrociliatus TaxID=2664684 RepID=A0A7I8WEY6_9ANNE|nr:unnamed protein product [Dimorphilus gyrociliatus]